MAAVVTEAATSPTTYARATPAEHHLPSRHAAGDGNETPRVD